MIFNEHYGLKGKHAFLSPSSYHWINYEQEKLDLRFQNHMTAVLGTQLHEFAHNAIKLRVKLQGKSTLSLYVNDAIGYRMVPEQVLYYSDNCFGTADAISFRKGLLRISDLKNGISRTSMKQLMVYAAIFCLEYDMRPDEMAMELRIYQHDEIDLYIPDPEEVLAIMGTIIAFDRRINELKALSGFEE